MILPHYDRVNGARSTVGAVSTLSGGGGSGRTASRILSSRLPGVKKTTFNSDNQNHLVLRESLRR